ncbi:MAG: cell division protein SepF [Firmicutes bacterium]|jgi:cell division inhibitor SepF|nr:cell division protein SepF [Bacillota bacterium]
MKNWDNGENWEQTEVKKGFLERVMNLLGIETEEIVEEVYLDEPAEAKPVKSGKERGKVVSLPHPDNNIKLVVFEPLSFDDVQTIVNHLKARRPVILNMEEIDKGLARRITDFVGGAVFALDGTVQKVSGSIMLFAPPNVEVALPSRSELAKLSELREIKEEQFFTTDKFKR